MDQQKILQNYQIKAYNTYLEFFQKSIGIIQPLREEIPHYEILEEVSHSLKWGYKDVGKAIIAKHALLSFFPGVLRKNSLIHLYVYRKLISGNSPITKKSKLALMKYVTWEEKRLEDDIKSHSELAIAMLNAMEILLPYDRFDFYFDNYLKLLNQWRESILEDDYAFLDAIMDDFWISKNWTFSPEELNMLVSISELFDSIKIPFSLSYYQDHVKENHGLLLKKFGNCRWITESQYIAVLWKKFANQGINFSYGVNTDKIGLRYCYFIIQVHPNCSIELLRFSFNQLKNLYYLFENWSQQSPVLFGVIYFSQNDVFKIQQFFTRLKEMGAIQDFLLIAGTKYEEKITYTKQIDSQFPELYSKITMEFDSQSIYKMDILDSIILFYLRLSGFVSYPLDDGSHFTKMIRAQIKSQISYQEKELSAYNSINDLRVRSAKDIIQLLPRIFYQDPPKNLEDCVLNLEPSDIELLYFFEKWYFILSQIKKCEKFFELVDLEYLKGSNPNLYIKIDSEIRNLTEFMSSYLKNTVNLSGLQDKYSIKTIIQEFIRIYKDRFDGIVSDLTDIIFFLTNRINLSPFDTLENNSQISMLQTLLSGSDEDLLKEFLSRLNKYIGLGLVAPQLFNSVVLGFYDYFECWIFPREFPKEVKEYICARFRTYTQSIQGNTLNSWELDLGLKNPSVIEQMGSVLAKLPVQFLSLIQTPYDPFYRYDFLYDFKNQVFPSLTPKIQLIIEFIQKHLRYSSNKHLDLFSDYLSQDSLSKKSNLFKSIPSLKIDSYCSTYNSIPDNILRNISQSMNTAREKDTLRFLDEENTSLTDIRIEVNWPRIGLEEYIVSFKVRKDKFTHSSIDSVILTREFMCLPGIKEIYTSTNTGYFHTYFVHYLFPFNSPAKNVFRTLERWRYIQDLTIIKIKSKNIWFNSQFLEDSITKFHTWELFAYRYITGNVKTTENIPISYSYSPSYKFFGPETSEYRTISKIYDKNIRKLKNLPIFSDIQKLFHTQLIWFIPNLMKILPLPHRLIIQIYPLNSKLTDIFISLFMTVPLSIIFKVEYEKDNRNADGLYVDLRFHPCNLSEFLLSIKKIIQFFKIKDFRITPSIIPMKKSEFAGNSLKNYPDLFKSFIWDHNQFRNIKYFDQSGPLTYIERYNQLR